MTHLAMTLLPVWLPWKVSLLYCMWIMWGFLGYLTYSVLLCYMGAEIHRVYGLLHERRTRPYVQLPISAVASFSFIVRYINLLAPEFYI